MDKTQEYEIQKENVFNKHKDKINWEEVYWEKFFAEELYECENIEDFIKKYRFADNKINELKKLKDKFKYQNKFINEIKQCTSENLKELLKNYKSQNKNKEFLWRNRGLTEAIAPEIIEDFDRVNIKEGKIYITVSLPLSPFFKGNSEKEFQKLRLTREWEKCIGYDEGEGEGKIKWPLYPDQNGIFTPDLEERELEKRCYDIKAFRGITYNEILTPIYKLDRDKLDIDGQPKLGKIILEEKRNISEKCRSKLKEVFLKHVFREIKKRLLENREWDIRVRITKGGLVNIFFEKDFCSADFCENEFQGITVKQLCEIIDKDEYSIPIKAPINTINWLNELLTIPNFHETLLGKKTNQGFSEEVKKLLNKTENYRNKKFSEMRSYEKSIIKRLNRLLLQETYQEAPKSRDYDSRVFATEKSELMSNPYPDETIIEETISEIIKELKNDGEELNDKEKEALKDYLRNQRILKKEQVFTSYLNAAAIWIAYIFLKKGKCECEKEGAKFWKYKELKDPWNVMYEAEVSGSIHDTPPLRNYCITIYLKDVEGIAWGVDKPLSTRVHFDCPGDIYKCEKGAECFIRYLGHSLLAVSTNTYMIKEDRLKRPWFTQKELENFAKRDLSRWRGELCLIDSETILICTSSDIEMINKEGQEVEYDIYWKSIIKGISLLVSCKTLAMDISRTLFECIRKYRDEPKAAGEILDTLKIISHLLSRARFIATPSNISRARYIREKFEAYIKASGLSEIINNIEKDYDEINEAIHASMGLKLTRDLVPLAFFTLLGTVILVFIELKGMKCNKIPICKTTIIFFVAFGITCLLKNIYKWIKK